MFKVTMLKTGETIEQPTREDAEFFVKLAVMVTNNKINRGWIKGKRDSKKKYIITEI